MSRTARTPLPCEGRGPNGAGALVSATFEAVGFDLGGHERPAEAGADLMAAFNDALTKAEEEAAGRTGGEPPEPTSEIAHVDQADSHTVGTEDGRLQVTVSTQSQRVTQIYVDDLSDEVLDHLVPMLNRALAAARQGRPDAVPLSTQLDVVMTELDTTMQGLRGRLAEVQARLRGRG